MSTIHYKVNILVIAGILLGLPCLLAQEQKKTKSREVVATVGGHEITKSEVFELFVRKYPIETYLVIEELILHWLIEEEFNREGITIQKSLIESKVEESIARTRKEQSEIHQTWEEYLKSQGLTEKKYRKLEFKKWKYLLALDRLVRLSEYRETRIEARHILVKTREEAEKIYQKLQQNADFAALAREVSLSRSEEGGRLPSMYRGDMTDFFLTPELEEPLFSLQPHKISDIIQSRWGFHIIEVLEISPGRPDATWPQIKSEVIKSLEERPVTPRDIDRWVKKMVSRYEIEIKLEFLQK